MHERRRRMTRIRAGISFKNLNSETNFQKIYFSK